MIRINTTLILILLFVSSINLFAIEKVAYHVEIESSNNSKITVPVPQLGAGQYQINSIYVKTKEKQQVSNNAFTSDVINTSLQNIYTVTL